MSRPAASGALFLLFVRIPVPVDVERSEVGCVVVISPTWGARQRFNFERMFRGKQADSLQKSRMANRSSDVACGGLLRHMAARSATAFAAQRALRTLSLHGSSLWLCVGRTVLEAVLLLHQPAESCLGCPKRREGARLCRGRGPERGSENG